MNIMISFLFTIYVYIHGRSPRVEGLKILSCSNTLYLINYYYLSLEANEDINLLAAVGSPFPPDVRAVTGPFGRLGRPAVEFTPKSYVGRWAKDLLKIPFFKDFGIKVSVFLQSIYGGVLFTVLEHDHSKSILSLNILQAPDGKQKIEFTYRNEGGPETARELITTFIVPRMDRRWVVFSLTVVQQEVTLYYSGCDRVLKTMFQYPRLDLAVRANSPIFLGNAGWYIEKPALYVRLFISCKQDVSVRVLPIFTLHNCL